MSQTEFVPSTAFLFKKQQQEELTRNTLREMFWQEIHALKSDKFGDTDIFIVEEGIHLRHLCIIMILAPNFFKLHFDDLHNEKTIMHTFPTEMPVEEKEMLRAVYNNRTNLNHNVDLTTLLNSENFDVMLKVEDKIFKCHKCILAARCEFFSLMFSGSWIENQIKEIPLQDISAQSFQILLNAIYNGPIDFPKKLNLGELLTFSEMYNISCANVILMYYLKVTHCHFFHQPCQFCILGVLDVLSICEGHIGFEDIIDNCYKWFTKYYVKILPTRQFAKSSKNVQCRLTQNVTKSASTSNILQHLQDCFHVIGRILQVNSMDSTRDLVNDMDNYFVSFFFSNFSSIIIEPSFNFMLVDDRNVDKHLRLQEHLKESLIKFLDSSSCIGIYKDSIVLVDKINDLIGIESNTKNEALKNGQLFSENINLICRNYIEKNILTVRRTKFWKQLPKIHRNKLMKNSGFLDLSS